MNKGKAARTTVAVLAVAGVAAGLYMLSARGETKNGAVPTTAQPRKVVPVVLTPARTMTFEDRLSVSGNVRAKSYAIVSARIGGTLDAVFVDEGDPVVAGVTALFQTDALNLARAVEVADNALRVAESSMQERQANLREVRAGHEQDQADANRYRALLRGGLATAQDMEIRETSLRQSTAKVAHAEALVALAEAQVQQAATRLEMARKDLADSRVLAPIRGRVTERMREPGEMAAPGTAVVRIEDLSVLEVSAHLPGEHYGHVYEGRTQMRVRVGGEDLGDRPITFKSPTVDPGLRTFEVRCLVKGPPAGVVPGALAEIEIVLESRQGLGVLARSVVTRTSRSVVFVAEGTACRMVEVRTGLVTDSWVEIVEGKLTEGAPVISMGQTLVDDGTPIAVVEGGL